MFTIKKTVLLGVAVMMALGSAVAHTAPYYDADYRIWTNNVPQQTNYQYSTTGHVSASDSIAFTQLGYPSESAIANSHAGPGYVGVYASSQTAGVNGFAHASAGSSMTISDLVFSGPLVSSQLSTAMNLNFSGFFSGYSAGNIHSRGGVGVGVQIRSGNSLLLDSRGGARYWSDPTTGGIQFVDATGLLQGFNQAPMSLSIPNIQLWSNTNYSLTLFMTAEADSGYLSANGGSTGLTVDFIHTLKFPTAGTLFSLSDGITVNSGEGYIVNNHWIDQSPAAVPIPAAVWLFGSGLLGLIGVARRKKA